MNASARWKKHLLGPLQAAGLSISTKGYEGYNQHLWAAEGPEVHGSCSTQLRFEGGLAFQPRQILLDSALWSANGCQ